MSFAKDVLLKPLPIIWSALTGAVTLITFFGAGSWMPNDVKIWASAALFFALLFVGIALISAQLHRLIKAPVRIRTVVEGSHYYKGQVIVILDKSSWIATGQLLTLVSVSDRVETPLALIHVETRTTEDYPQCSILVSLTDETLESYLRDRSRWQSMSALTEIKASYLEASLNV